MKVGFTAGAFDLLHAGHVLMLEECASKCDKLIVGLHLNPSSERPEKNKPIQSVVERYIQLKSVKFVSEIIPYETEQDLADLLIVLPINIRFIGEDWKHKNFTGKKLAGTRHKIIYNRRGHSFSSSDLRKRIKDKK
tara:strand:- start:193 stop:600 length:408 start_codon:yes stop_codon:yes gene_type:complete